MRKMFMGYTSHEVRTPISTVSLGTKLLRSRLLKEFPNHQDHPLISLVDEIQISNNIALNILNNTLTYDKVENGILNVELELMLPWSFLEMSIKPFHIQVRNIQFIVVPNYNLYLIIFVVNI